MLWRTCQVFRHFSSPVNFLCRTYNNNFTRQPARCASAALALQVRAVARHPSTAHVFSHGTAQSPPDKPNAFTSWKETRQRKSRYLLPQPAPELVDMVNRLYHSLVSEDATVEDMESLVEPPELLDHLRNHDKAIELAALMANVPPPGRAYRVLRLAHKFGCYFKQNGYERVAYQLAQTGRWSEMAGLIALGQRQTGRTSLRLLNWRTRALVEIRQYRLLDNVLADFEEANIQPNRRTYQSLVSGHLRNHDLDKARECIDWMEDAGFPMDASTHAMLASGYKNFGADAAVRDRALHSLSEVNERSGRVCLNTLIQVAADAGDTDGALRCLSHFDKPLANRGLSGGDVRSTSRPDGVPDGSQAGLASQTVPARRLSPDATTFAILINHAAKLRDVQFAQKILGFMQAYDVEPDSDFVAALVNFYCSTGQFSLALDAAASLCPDKPAALRYLRYLGWQGGLMSSIPRNATHTPLTISALLKGTLYHRGLKGMLIFNGFMASLDMVHTTQTIDIFMSYIAKTCCVRPRELVRILRSFSAKSRPTLRHIHIMFAAILRKQRAYSTRRGWQNVADMLRTRQQPASLPDADQTASASASKKKFLSYAGLITPLLRTLSHHRVQPDKALMQLRILYEGVVMNNTRSAETTLQTMLDRGLHANQYHYAAMMESYCLAGDMRAALEEFRKARQAGFGWDPVMYTIVISGYARTGNTRHASRIFEQMLMDKIRPDVAAVDALASAYFIKGRRRVARQILIDHWSLFGPFPPELQNSSLKILAQRFRMLDKQVRKPFVGRQLKPDSVHHLNFRRNLRKVLNTDMVRRRRVLRLSVAESAFRRNRSRRRAPLTE